MSNVIVRIDSASIFVIVVVVGVLIVVANCSSSLLIPNDFVGRLWKFGYDFLFCFFVDFLYQNENNLYILLLIELDCVLRAGLLCGVAISRYKTKRANFEKSLFQLSFF